MLAIKQLKKTIESVENIFKKKSLTIHKKLQFLVILWVFVTKAVF